MNKKSITLLYRVGVWGGGGYTSHTMWLKSEVKLHVVRQNGNMNVRKFVGDVTTLGLFHAHVDVCTSRLEKL